MSHVVIRRGKCQWVFSSRKSSPQECNRGVLSESILKPSEEAEDGEEGNNEGIRRMGGQRVNLRFRRATFFTLGERLRC